MVKSNGMVTKIEPIPVNPVDTTGAGDLFAAGFLYGITMNLGFEKAGYIGSLLGATVIKELGAKIKSEDWKVIMEKIGNL